MKPRRKHKTGTVTSEGYIYQKRGGVGKFQHIWIAEKALGKPLPPSSGVHHVNGCKGDNRTSNLVIYPNQKYHLLLHRRSDAYAVTGDANKRKCSLCGDYDAPENLYIRDRLSVHKVCKAAYDRKRRVK
jgi:hypothetical protein